VTSENNTLRVAIAQPYTRLGDVEGNLAQVKELATEAAANGCELILFPEVALHGYSVPPEVLEKAVVADGEVAEKLVAHSDREKIIMATGVFERDPEEDVVYISQFITFPEGRLLVQRKHGGHEKPGIAKAPLDPKIFEVNGVKCCVTICIDTRIKGIENMLVDLGCQLQLAPTAGGGAYPILHQKDLDDPEKAKKYVEAMEDSCFPKELALVKRYRLRMALATANLATGFDGADYVQQGHSMLMDSTGGLLALIPGTYIQEHFRPRVAWGDIHPQQPRRLPESKE